MRLNEICEVYSGYALKSFNDSEVGLPVVKIGNILTDGTLNLDECQYTTDCVNEKYYSNKDDIYIALSGATIGKIGIMDADERYVVNQRVGIVRKKSDDVPQEYIKYFLLKQTNRILQEAAGCAQPNISPKQIAEYSVPEVSKEKMFEVCIVLDTIKRIIDMRKAELTALDNLIKARFVEMFGDPVSNSFGLPEATLSELGEFGRGVSKHRPRNDPELLGGEYPLIQTGDVANAGLYITSYNSTYSELGLKQSKMWDKGTLCITIAANIAKTAILEFDACFPDSVVGFVSNDKTSNVFIHYWFSFFQAILEAQAPESAQKNINLKILSELKIIVPPIKLQNQFAAFVKQTDKSKSAVKKSIKKLEILKKSLMQQYFGRSAGT